MKTVRFIHAADLHLDSPMTGFSHLPEKIFRKIQESTFASLANIVDTAIAEMVDFVILAGDIFDAEDRSIRAQVRFKKEMERLHASHIPVYIVHGNHDHMEGKWTHLPLPDNVFIFGHEVECKAFKGENGTEVHLYGFSYPSRHVYERMIQHYRRKGEADFHIGILHGNLDGKNDHGSYAPFTLPELAACNFDYWALGHIHKRTILQEDPPIIYPGNIQGRHRKEFGEKGCYFIELTEAKASCRFIETAEVLWEESVLPVSGAASFHDVYLLCAAFIEKKRERGKNLFLSLILEDFLLTETDFNAIRNGDLLEMLQEEEQDEDTFIWIPEIMMNETQEYVKEQLAAESDFFSDLFQESEDDDLIAEALAQLYMHPSARKYLQPLTEEELESVKKEAEQLLVGLLHSEEHTP